MTSRSITASIWRADTETIGLHTPQEVILDEEQDV